MNHLDDKAAESARHEQKTDSERAQRKRDVDSAVNELLGQHRGPHRSHSSTQRETESADQFVEDTLRVFRQHFRG